ncbi:cation:proton antiporter [Vulcanisaeta souniana]|uniref:Sodium:proton antiporter n=1 Tax=Vulcanisaeta souniana JCM 11219 TaxID=1293586 RepID=A0A830E0N5_9CREN|nr:cation:proton antiporter [Vulcanisaeta souniana]BDR92391.1 sodium:proton antiporter [Vulcanisaeta souniana JCM 11219]GGI75211.1 sodium:proton antiporter [Vulcanisaeta souniana JCM 11219]
MPTGETIFLTLLEVSILILLADLAGGVLSRYGFPRVVAELLIGLALSPYALGSLLNAFMHLELFTINDYLLFLTNLSIILLLFASGLEHGLSTLREGGIYGVLAAVFGAITPFALVYWALTTVGLQPTESAIIALSTAPTSLAVVAGIIEREGLTGLPSTRVLITAASIDDVVALILLSMVITTVGAGGLTYGAITAAVKTVALWVLVFILSVLFIPRALNRVGEEVITYASLVVLFGIVLIMTTLGFSEVIAAFIAGVAVAESRSSQRVRETVNVLLAIFGSIFFIAMGLQLNFRYILNTEVLVVALVVSLAAVVGKVVGIYPFAYLRLRNRRDSMVVSYGMIPRGEMGLVIASIGLSSGLINMGEFGIIILMVLITTIVGAVVYRREACRVRLTRTD